ncbi:MAG: hypothetical protein FWC55_04050, partial [Firmicutes bacterium]|nr:hypothetical protein [Bacillota bacterium]
MNDVRPKKQGGHWKARIPTKFRPSLALLLALTMLVSVLPPFQMTTSAQMSTNQKTKANFIDVKVGSWHVLALDDEGRIYTWYGGSYPANLGRPINGDGGVAVQLTQAYDSGGLVPMPWIKKISSSESTCLALDTNGNIWSWGGASNPNNAIILGHSVTQVGTQNYPQKVDMPAGVKAIDIAAANGGGRFIGSDGNIYVWG